MRVLPGWSIPAGMSRNCCSIYGSQEYHPPIDQGRITAVEMLRKTDPLRSGTCQALDAG